MGHLSRVLSLPLMFAFVLASGAAEVRIDGRFATPRPETLLALPSGVHQAMATADGGLRFGDGGTLSIAPTKPFAVSPGRQRLADGRLPIVTTAREGEKLALELTTFVGPAPPTACIRCVVRNKTAAAIEPVLRLQADQAHAPLSGEHIGFQRDGQLVALCEIREGKAEVVGAGKPKRHVFRREGGRQLPGWARPKGRCDRGFSNIVAGFAEPATYHLKADKGKRYVVAVGLCESHWKEPRKRICDILIEGKRVARIDPIAKPNGTDVPFVLTYPATDGDGNGWITVASVAAPGSPDVNSIINVVWLFDESVGKGLSPEEILLGNANRLAHCYVDCGGRVDAPGPATLDLRLSLPPNGSATLWLKRPFAATKVADAPKLAATDPAKLLAAAEGAWKAALGRTATLETGDAASTDILNASIANLLALRSQDGGRVTLRPGPFGPAFSVGAAALGAVALDRMGLHAEAAELLADLVARRGNERLWRSPEDAWTPTGQALWALATHFQLTGDTKWLAANYKPIIQAAEALVEARERTKWIAHDPTLYFHGLLPAAPYRSLPADHWLVHDFWACCGIRCAAAAARALAKPNDYKWLEDNLDDYAASLRRAIAQSAVVGPAAGCFPGAPGESSQWTFASCCAALYPTPALPRDDKLAAATFAYLDANAIERLPGGLDGRSPALDVPLACHYALARLAAGDADGALAAFTAIANLAPTTGTLPAQADLKARRASGLAPSAAAAAGYILLLRDMLVAERADELHLCPCVPQAWLAKGVAVARAPTSFGPLACRARLDGAKLVVEATIPSRRAPKAVVIGLPRPARRIKAARASAGKVAVLGDSVRVVGWTGAGRLEIDLQ